LAAPAIREKWLSSELPFWVQWMIPDRGGSPSGASLFPGVEAARRSVLDELEQRGSTGPQLFLNADLDQSLQTIINARESAPGLTFETIINASESGLYLDGRSAACLFTSRAAAAQFWPWLGDQPKTGANLVTQGRRSPRGAKTAFDWEEALVEGCGFLIENGLPEDQAALVAHIAEWFGEDGPGDTQIKEHLAPLYRRAQRAFGR
jgi:hypothetical protein